MTSTSHTTDTQVLPDSTEETVTITPTDSAEPKVWTAADAPAYSSESRPAHVRVGQLIWGCIVSLLGVFFLALPFISGVNVPAVLIGLIGVLGISLIVAAVVVGKEPAPDQVSR